MKNVKIDVGDILTMKKNHPCGSNRFRVNGCGSDIRLVCLGCNHNMTIDRLKLEKSIKEVEKNEKTVEQNQKL